jgi:uncharacterized membrane protein YraQ (UPF0718 family)
LNTLIPYDSAKGEEGVSVQGLILIVLLGLLALFAWKGFENIHQGRNKFTIITFLVLIITLLIGATRMVTQPAGLDMIFTGRFIAVTLLLAVIGTIVVKYLTKDEITDWIWESWRFMKQIFPLLLVGVFTVGIIRQLIQPEWIEFLAGKNSVTGNLAGVLFGVFMYFPTLVEVPIAKMFLNLGMHRGPLLAYLMADPELSLQSILITATIIGKTKAWVYVGWVALFSTLAGLIYGAYIDGAGSLTLISYLLAITAVLAALLWFVTRQKKISA